MVQKTIEHCRGQHGVTRECLIPAAERQVGGQDRRALFVTPSDDLEEQVCLLPAERQVANFVDD
jgi:hypothetical protein